MDSRILPQTLRGPTHALNFHNKKEVASDAASSIRSGKSVSPGRKDFSLSRSPWGASDGNEYRDISPIGPKPVFLGGGGGVGGWGAENCRP